MADLDDFFAKKDKKKSKTKKFLTPEEVVKKLEDTSKKVEQQAQASKPLRKVDQETTEPIEQVSRHAIPIWVSHNICIIHLKNIKL